MKRPTFSESPDLWEQDGSLRDVYFLDTSELHWIALFAVAGRFPHRYTFNGELGVLPSANDIFSNGSGSHLLVLKIGVADVNCHFFTQAEIELDIDPTQVVLPGTHEQILQFLESCSMEMRKDVIITVENVKKLAILTYSFSDQNWIVH
jgi:hypothetical protein